MFNLKLIYVQLYSRYGPQFDERTCTVCAYRYCIIMLLYLSCCQGYQCVIKSYSPFRVILFGRVTSRHGLVRGRRDIKQIIIIIESPCFYRQLALVLVPVISRSHAILLIFCLLSPTS